MKRGLIEGLGIIFFATLDGTLLWIISIKMFNAVLSWGQCWAICAILMLIVSSALRISREIESNS